MRAQSIVIQRVSVVSTRRFEDVMQRLTLMLGQPDMTSFHDAVKSATLAELSAVVDRSVESSALMELARFDAGAVLRKEPGGHAARIVRLMIGNPLLMKEMARSVHDAAAYAPVTVLIDERRDGVHLSYDLMESLLAPYCETEVVEVARALDVKVTSLMERAAIDTV
jgi:hypothetical protein